MQGSCLLIALSAGWIGHAAAAVDAVDTREHPVTFPLGVMMLGLALLAVPFHYLKQSNIIGETMSSLAGVSAQAVLS
jgi:hypothetical protein